MIMFMGALGRRPVSNTSIARLYRYQVGYPEAVTMNSPGERVNIDRRRIDVSVSRGRCYDVSGDQPDFRLRAVC
jgi:hypothetical protein